MARAGPIFGEPKVGDDWVVTPFWLTGDTPRTLRVYVNPPHGVTRDIDASTTLWRWDGLPSGSLVNLRIDAVYDDPDEVVSSTLQVWTLRNGNGPIGPVHGLRATASPDEVVLEWDSLDPRATQLEILRDDGVGVLTSAVTSWASGNSHHADVQPLKEYHYTVRSLANGGEAAAATVSIRIPSPRAAPEAARWQKAPVSIGFGSTTQPAVTSRVHGVVDLFYLDGQTKILHRREISELGITNESLPLRALNAPEAQVSATSLNPRHLDVVWGFQDGRHAWWDGQAWHEEIPFGIPPGAASVGIHENERIDYFWASGGAVQHKWCRQGDWHAAQNVGGSIGGSRIAATAYGPDRIDLFYSSPSNALIHRQYDPNREWWSDEETLGQLKAPIGGLAAACAPPDLHVFYVRLDGKVAYRALRPDNTWGDERADIPGIDVEVAALAATAWQPFHFDLIFANTRGILWRTWLST